MARAPRPRPSPLALTRALREFVVTESAGSVVLLLATIAALVWANSPWDASYETLWRTDLAVTLGGHEVALDLRHWVNDGLMAIFFVVVGLEVKRELLEGELRDPRKAALPVIAAVGGMVVPALLYLAVAGGDTAGRGWGIPMATDIAFALGVLGLVGRGLPSALRLFLLTLAIADDIGAIVVIAIFYSEDLEGRWLLAAVLGLVCVRVIRTVIPGGTPFFVASGLLVWLALHASGVHPTLAGVAMGLLAPSRPALHPDEVEERQDELLDVFSARAARATSTIARRSVSEMEWLEHLLHPWTSLLIVPLFALANAGVALNGDVLMDAASSSLSWGIVVGLVLGKPLGILLTAWLGCRIGVAELPDGVRWRDIAGVGTLAGIGFTVSLFIAGLAFGDATLQAEATIAVLVASVVAAACGSVVLRAAPRRPDA